MSEIERRDYCIRNLESLSKKCFQSLDICYIRNKSDKGSFKNYVDKILTIFDYLPTSTWTFFTLNVDKMKHFLTTYPPHHVHVVFDRPLLGNGSKVTWTSNVATFFKCHDRIARREKNPNMHNGYLESIIQEWVGLTLRFNYFWCYDTVELEIYSEHSKLC